MHLAYCNIGWDFCLKFTAERLKKAVYRIVTHRLRNGCHLMIVGGPILYHCELSVWKLEILMEIKIRALNVKRATMFTAQNLCH